MSTYTLRPTRAADMRAGDRFRWEGHTHVITYVDEAHGWWETTCDGPPDSDRAHDVFGYCDDDQEFDVIVGEAA